MKYFKFLLFSIFCLLSLVVSAQTTSDGDFLTKFTVFMQTWGVFILAVWEVVIRYIPTAKTYSILTLLMRIVQALVPDQKTGAGAGNLTHDSATPSIAAIIKTALKDDNQTTK